MSTPKFITLRLIKQTWDGSEYRYVRGSLMSIRIDTITEVHQLDEKIVYSSDAQRQELRYKSDERDPHPRAMIARISTTNAHGLGINGLQFDHTIDEKSWKLVCKELGLTWK